MIQKRFSDSVFAFLALIAVSAFYATAIQAHSVSRPLPGKTYIGVPHSLIHDGLGTPNIEVITSELYKHIGGVWVFQGSANATCNAVGYWGVNVSNLGAGDWRLVAISNLGGSIPHDFTVIP